MQRLPINVAAPLQVTQKCSPRL